jgi:hypothetical protein
LQEGDGNKKAAITFFFSFFWQRKRKKKKATALDEATSDRSVVTSNQEIGEQNCVLSQLKHKDSISIDCFRICGH